MCSNQQNFSSDVDELSTLISDYRIKSFPAKLIVRGIHQFEYEEVMDDSLGKDIDIFDYVGKEHKKFVIRLINFDSANGFEKRKNLVASPSSFDKVMIYLMSQAHSSGDFDIILDGMNNKNKNEKRVRCYYGKKYVDRTNQSKEDGNSFRDDAITNLRQYNRPDGKKLCRRSKSKRPDKSDKKCNVFFILGFDIVLFYIKCGYGNCTHEGHSSLCSSHHKNVSSKMLNETQKTVIDLCNRAKTSGSTGVDLVNVENQNKFTRHQVHYMKKLVKQVKGLAGAENVSDTDSLMMYFESLHMCRYVILYNEGSSIIEGADGRLMCQEVVDKDEQKFEDQAIEVYNEEEKNDVYSFCVKQCNAVNADPSSKMVIGTAWTHKHLRRIAKAYGDVIFVDATEGTNDEERPLLTLSVRNSLMKQVVVLRAVLPNNQRWVYRWFFEYVIPSLIGKTFCREVKLVLTDGDWNEMACVDDSFNSCFLKATRGRCGWHVVDRGWARHLDGVVSCRKAADRSELSKIKRTIQCWLYSWMKSSVLTEEEYTLSKCLFFAYVDSSIVTKVVGTKGSKAISEFVRNYVICHESSFAFYRRSNIRHFEIYTNTPMKVQTMDSNIVPCQHFLAILYYNHMRFLLFKMGRNKF